jgi:hypothetical protein
VFAVLELHDVGDLFEDLNVSILFLLDFDQILLELVRVCVLGLLATGGLQRLLEAQREDHWPVVRTKDVIYAIIVID